MEKCLNLLPFFETKNRIFPGGAVDGSLLPIHGMQVPSLGGEDPLEEEMATPPVFLPA